MKNTALFKSVLTSLVPISALNQGKANQIIADLDNDSVKIVVKNNEPKAAIISIDRYTSLLEMEERLNSLEVEHVK